MRIVLIAALILPGVATAHEGKVHHKGMNHVPVVTEHSRDTFARINEIYVQKVKPIFQKKCFDCHSQTPSLPWYYALPFVSNLLDNDMSEAKEHIDFGNDFPFSGHGKPKDDLEAIRDTVKNKKMPPLRYMIMHWNSALTDDEVKRITEWTKEGLDLLK